MSLVKIVTGGIAAFLLWMAAQFIINFLFAPAAENGGTYMALFIRAVVSPGLAAYIVLDFVANRYAQPPCRALVALFALGVLAYTGWALWFNQVHFLDKGFGEKYWALFWPTLVASAAGLMGAAASLWPDIRPRLTH